MLIVKIQKQQTKIWPDSINCFLWFVSRSNYRDMIIVTNKVLKTHIISSNLEMY